MKKHKSVVAILLAVMMIFTMMPMMAFADGEATPDYTWAADLSQVTGSDGYVYKELNKVFDPETGLVEVTVNQDKYGWTVSAPPAYYVDLTGATFMWNNKAFATVYKSGTDFSKADFALKVKAPAGTSQNPNATAVFGLSTDNWTGKVNVSKYDLDSTEDQTVTVSLEQSWKDTPKGLSETDPVVKGVVDDATTTVSGRAASANDALFYFDEVGEPKDGVKSGSLTTDYDGAEHKVVMNTVKGFSVKYTVFNATTGNWDAVDAVTIKDVQVDKNGVASPMKVRASISEDAKPTAEPKVVQLSVNLIQAKAPVFSFEKDGNKGSYSYFVEADEFNVKDFIVVNAADEKDDAGVAAVAANQAELLAYFDDFYETSSTVTKADPNKYEIAFAKKTLKDAEKKELVQKYATLLANFAVPTETVKKAYLQTNTSPESWEIEFTKSPTKKTYKAKVLKKKAKSFKVTATCTSGADVSYKLINAPEKIVINKKTGKITLKKGLKKGTYKIRVKAYLATRYELKQSGYNVDHIYEYHDITIKVKK